MIIKKEYHEDNPPTYVCDGICCAVDKNGNECECEEYIYYNGCEVDLFGGVKRIVENNFDFRRKEK